MMKITGLSHLFKWENLHNWWLTKYFFAPLYMVDSLIRDIISIILFKLLKFKWLNSPGPLCRDLL